MADIKRVKYRKPFFAVQWDGTHAALGLASMEAAARGYTASVACEPDCAFDAGKLRLSRPPWSYHCPREHWLIFSADLAGLPFILSDYDFAAQFVDF